MQRRLFLEKIEKQFNIHSVCAILGPRQVGKTTLAHMFIEHTQYKNVLFFDLLDHNIIGCGLDVIGSKKITVSEIISM